MPSDDLAARLQAFLVDRDARSAPYGVLGHLVREAPVVRLEGGTLVVAGYDAVGSALRDPRLGKGAGSPDALAPRPGTRPRSTLPPAVFTASLVNLNPPDHTRLRDAVSAAFSRRRIQALAPAITATADRLLAGIGASGGGDLLADVAFALPVWTIGQILGIPEGARAAFGPLVRDQALLYEPGVTDAEIAAGMRAARRMAADLAALVRARRRDPADDVLSALLAARDDDGQPLRRDEVIGLAMLLLGAGFETTTNLIGNAFATLLGRPADIDRLTTDPALVPAAVEEVLRFESPVQLAARLALEPTAVAGHPVDAGQWVVCLLGAANRDPARYADPDRFVLDRFAPAAGQPAPPPLSFSAGIHHCLGAPLARLEATIVLERWLMLGPPLDLVEAAPVWRPHITSRGLAHLRVEARPTGPA